MPNNAEIQEEGFERFTKIIYSSPFRTVFSMQVKVEIYKLWLLKYSDNSFYGHTI